MVYHSYKVRENWSARSVFHMHKGVCTYHSGLICLFSFLKL